MFFNIRIAADIFAFYYVLRQFGQFFFQSGWQHCQSHYFDQTDIFFLNVVQFLMWMVHT